MMKNKKIAVLAGAALLTVGLATLSGCSTESDKTKMNLEDLERANMLVNNIKILELLAKSKIYSIDVKYPDKRNDHVSLADELENVFKEAMRDYAGELKAELKELGVDYE